MNVNNEMSAMNVKKQFGNTWQKRESKEAKMRKKCDHYLMKGHTKEECFQLVGYPDQFKNPSKGKATQKTAANVSKKTTEYARESPLDKNTEQDETSGSKTDATLISSYFGARSDEGIE